MEMNTTAAQGARLCRQRWIEYQASFVSSWAQIANEALQERGFQCTTMDSRTLKDQGIDSTSRRRHRGPAVTAIMRRGGHSYVADRIRTEQLAIRSSSRTSANESEAHPVDRHWTRAAARQCTPGSSYREQGPSAQAQARRERAAHDLER
jgi:hypothetical protein